MSTPKLPLTFSASALPAGATYTPQQFLDAIVARLSINSEENYSIITVSNTLPTSNIGPVLLGGLEWYVWDPTSGAYIPIPKEPNYPFRADLTATQDQVFTVAGTLDTDLPFTEAFDPNNVFGTDAFHAPVDGYYQISVAARIAAIGSPAPSSIYLELKKNGVPFGDNVALTPGYQGMYQINTVLQLTAGDSISAHVVSTATAAGTISIIKQGTMFSGFRIQGS